jgi:hypothetical protein
MSTVELIRDRAICSRKERRYTASSDRLLRCETTVEEGGLRPGHVVDLSSSGIRLLCDGLFQVGQTIRTQLLTDRSHGIYCGTVRRVEPWVDGQSILGCSLEDAIPQSVLEELAAEGIVNRRSDDRYTVDRTAAVSWQLNTGEVEVKIKDYSSGGLRVESSLPIPTDTRLRIRIELSDEELVLTGKSVWQQESADRYMAGIAFTHLDAPTHISKLAPRQTATLPSAGLPSSDRPISVLRGLAVATGVAAACYVLTLIAGTVL